jgi:hypothetical protein
MSSVYIISHHERRWHFHAWIHGLSGAYRTHEADLPKDFTSEDAALSAAIRHADEISAPRPVQVFSLNEKGATRLLFERDGPASEGNS